MYGTHDTRHVAEPGGNGLAKRIIEQLCIPRLSYATILSRQLSDYVETIVQYRPVLQETVDPHIKKIYLEKIKPQGEKGFTSPETGLERVRNQFHSFVVNIGRTERIGSTIMTRNNHSQVEVASAHHIVAKTWQEHEKCNLIEMEFYKMPTITIYVIKNSGYKDVFKQKYVVVGQPPAHFIFVNPFR